MLTCTLLGAIGGRVKQLLFPDLGLELVDYQCSGGESNLSSCTMNSLTACQAVATVRCQGTLLAHYYYYYISSISNAWCASVF